MQLIIVESPTKAKTISRFLGNKYKVRSSYGHVRDLPKNEMGIDIEHNFRPKYVISPKARTRVKNLKEEAKKAEKTIMATDEDREGEAIAWHLSEILNLNPREANRIVFHEITKKAILDALKNHHGLNLQLVDAQQARRILDRAVGYGLSPLLWKKIRRGLSAWRVQSVAVRIIVEKEDEIRAFNSEEFWKVKADIVDPKMEIILSKINGKKEKVVNQKEADAVKKSAESGKFIIKDIIEKPWVNKAPKPFTTSTLQQESARKLWYSVSQTMVLAQQLYEGLSGSDEWGLITYMRTDSLNLSGIALKQSAEVIKDLYWKEYYKKRTFKTNSKGAQEAHEAIRPTDLSKKPSELKWQLDAQQYKLYELIWQRTIATQMADAKVMNTTITIEAGKKQELLFVIKGKKIEFPWFMKSYTEWSDDPDMQLANSETILPETKKWQELKLDEILLEQCFTKPPARYTEASLVKKMESEWIGRPSTYAPTISTIQNRGYVEKIEKKLHPTEIGEVVNKFLVNHFPDIVDLKFTAKIEEEFDTIAEGKQEWKSVMKSFYKWFIEKIDDKTINLDRADVMSARELWVEPKTWLPVYAKLWRFGPMIQIWATESEDKPKFASIPKDKKTWTITLEEALELFKLPRILGETKKGEEVSANAWRFGPYVKVAPKEFHSIKDWDPNTITLEEALVIIQEWRDKKAKALIKDFPKDDIQIIEWRYGPYIKFGKKNVKIPKDKDAKDLTIDEIKEIIKNAPAKKRGFKKKKAS